jgi:oxalate decarboxylase/phosphoglucose isomerase-like protein (cupin superfamily)
VVAVFSQLVFGERRWFLTPPRFAKVRTGSVIDWFEQEYTNITYRADHEVIEVTQRPGEMLFVPSGWGHAVINIGNVVRCD